MNEVVVIKLCDRDSYKFPFRILGATDSIERAKEFAKEYFKILWEDYDLEYEYDKLDLDFEKAKEFWIVTEEKAFFKTSIQIGKRIIEDTYDRFLEFEMVEIL